MEGCPEVHRHKTEVPIHVERTHHNPAQEENENEKVVVGKGVPATASIMLDEKPTYV